MGFQYRADVRRVDRRDGGAGDLRNLEAWLATRALDILDYCLLPVKILNL